MTLKYKVFRIPGNVEEFLQKQKKNGNKKIKIGLYTHSEYEEMGFSSEHYALVLGDEKENQLLQVCKTAGANGFGGIGNHTAVKSDILKEADSVINECKRGGFTIGSLKISYHETKTLEKIASAVSCITGLGTLFCLGEFGKSLPNYVQGLTAVTGTFALFGGALYPYFKNLEKENWEQVYIPGISPSSSKPPTPKSAPAKPAPSIDDDDEDEEEAEKEEEKEKIEEEEAEKREVINPWDVKIDTLENRLYSGVR